MFDPKESYHEVKKHADKQFPYNIYPCSIPLDFQKVPVHWHEDMEIIIVKKGCGIILADRIAYQVQAGEFVVLFPGQLHGIEQFGQLHMEYENIIFKLSMLMSTMADLCTADFLMPLVRTAEPAALFITPAVPEYEAMITSIELLDRVCQERFYGYQLAVKGALFQLLSLLLKQFPLLKEEKTDKAKEKIKMILQYIENHYYEKITIEQAAEFCFYSKSHFMKFFKAYTGVSFIEYLNDYRLGKAAEQLVTTNKPIIDIAIEHGFDNISYFNRLFRRKYQKTPGEYR